MEKKTKEQEKKISSAQVFENEEEKEKEARLDKK